MNERRFMVLALATAAVAALVLALAFHGRSQPPTGPLDPAVEHYTAGRDSAYAGIDRWAYAGMTQEMLTVRLQQAGYTCAEPSGAGEDAAENVVCTQWLRWPLRRRLVITATVEGEPQRRLAAARAASVLASDSAVVAAVADWLRRAGWLEPQELAVRGFDIADPDLLARFAVDALRGGWSDTCAEANSATVCAAAARTRRASGFPPVDGGVAVPDAAGVVRALTRLRLQPAVSPHWLGRPTEMLPVRVAGDEMWLDFSGRDLAGHEWQVAVQLAFEGGRPVKLLAAVDGRSREVPLAGQARQREINALEYLVPQRGAERYRLAAWLVVPRPNEDFLFKRIAEVLPRADEAFGARMMKLLLDGFAAPDTPDMVLGLHPLLLTVERRAETLRAVNARQWLPEPEGLQLVRAAYADDPALRAAWALAVCAPEPDSPGAGMECWRRAMVVDPELPGLLRADLALVAETYATLPPDHPLRARLQRWHALLSS